MRKLLLALLPIAASWPCSGRGAEQCPPLTIIGTVPMQFGVDGRIYVRTTVNGSPVSMLVDTGGFFTEIAQPLVTVLKLPTFHTGFRLVGLSNLMYRGGWEAPAGAYAYSLFPESH